MKKILLLFIISLAIEQLVLSQTIVKVGAFNFYPAIFLDNDGIIKGFYCDALQELGEKENIKFVYVYGSWDEGLERIKNGEVDVLTSVAVTDERLKYMDYTSTALLTVWSEVYINPATDIRGILDLNGKSVAVMKNDVNGEQLRTLTEKFNVNCRFVETIDFEQVFRLIAKGEVDAGVVNNTFGAPKSVEYGLLSSGIVFNPFEIYLTVKKDSNKELLNKFNTYLHRWKHDRNSVLNTARQKWSHNRVGEIEVFPKWIEKAVYLVLIVVLVLVLFITLLRIRVRSAIRKLKYSESLFETFMDNTPAYVYIKDTNLNHIYQNKKVNSVDSKDKNSSAKTIFEAHIAELIEKSDAYILNSKKESVNIQYQCKLNGKEVWLDDYKFYLQQPDGNPAIGGVSFDITRLKNTELDLIKAKEKAEESDRLKTAFLQNMSHEIRTPMNAIMGFSGLLPSIDDKEKLKYFSGIINQRCEDLLNIINDILDISKIESGQFPVILEECDLNELFTELQTFFIENQKRIGKNHINFSLKASCEPYHTTIITDKGKLKQIFINLIGNAFKFTDNGKIEGGCKYDKDNNLVFYVEDTGVGIAREHHLRIFDRFSQVSTKIETNMGGTGLGLSIVKGLVDLLGGQIYLESELGKGSLFYFSIPFNVSQKLKSELPQKEISTNEFFFDKTILIVEDDYYNAEYLKEILFEKCSNIIHTTMGIDAVEIATAQPVDLILMDVRLPDIDGYEATARIRKAKPHIAIIAQTAYTADNERQKSISAGCVDYISKPTQQDRLLKLMEKYLE